MKKIITLFICLILIAISVASVSNGSTYRANAFSHSSSYTRINFNISSITETLPLSSVRHLLAVNNLKPIRIWVLIDDDITAMFTFQKNWNINDIDKIISKQILTNYKVKFRNDVSNLNKITLSKKNASVVKSYENLINQDKRIVKSFSKNAQVKVLAVDLSEPHIKKAKLKVPMQIKQNRFSVSFIPVSNIIPSPQMQYSSKSTNDSEFLSDNTYNSPPPPDDSTWLPNYVSTDIRTLQDYGQTRYINQQVEWFDLYRLSYFWNGYDYEDKHYATAYEQDTIFWRENYNASNDTGNSYILYTDPPDTSMINSWYSNLPGPYLDSRLFDKHSLINIGIGCSRGKDLEISQLYYYTMYVKKGNVNSGYELQTEEQPCYYKYSHLTPRLGIFNLTSHVDCYKWYVPGFYQWNH